MNLSDDALARVAAQLPDISKIANSLIIDPSVVASRTGPSGTLDVAVVCFNDAYNVLWESVHALGQAYSYLIWYREEAPGAPSDAYERSAVLFAKFYADDVALRLYASGEHSAKFIKNFLKIDDAALKAFKEDLNKKSKITVSSDQAVIGRFTVQNYPDHPISKSIKALLVEGSWGKTRKYRDTWVHEQPPLLDGFGITYERKSRWEMKEGYADLFIGGGDAPKMTVDELVGMVAAACHAYARHLSELFDVLLTELDGKYGIKFDFDKGNITFSL